ncbi:MAG TPA: homogentisate 1,2-dioxygenase [Caulobacteraceae bacterium]|jgi:homogentisate 1,2-dioxygenase|nr:homogentisate 1,2-dioxygenase [Caulobacteraceae bacterium]
MAAKTWIPVRGAQGRHSRQAHADLPEGTYEREVSKEGFFGPAAFFYHPRPPTGWSGFEGPLRPRAFDLNGLNETHPSPWDAPVVLSNAACEMRFWKLAEPMPALARDADGDLLVFVHQGEGELFCDYGRLVYGPGDYLYLPRGTMWRLAPASPTAALTIEATNSHFGLPEKGMLGPHAVFDPAMLETPAMDEAFRAHQALAGEVRVEIKKRGQVSAATFPYNPLDAVGWHGDLAPVRLNVRDIRPVVSARYHLPPSVHTTFVADRFVVCTFAPRPFETDPGAIKVPFFHNNDDFDEVIFYHAGDFFSRDHIEAGMMTLHPSGFTHGPHPKALSRMFVQPKPQTDEYAVMVDARDPLDVGAGAASVENTAYVDSWKAAAEPAAR